MGRAVRAARTARGMTQTELGEPLLTKGFISQIENGVSSASLESMFFIADRLDTRPAHLLAAADPVIAVEATLDMAEAALVLEGPDAAAKWLDQLPELVDEADTPAAAVVERIVGWSPRASQRLNRYRALGAMLRGDAEQAIQLLKEASSPTHPDAALVRFWLGEAYRRAGRRRDAMLTWERLIEANDDPLLNTVTVRHLAGLYEAMGDVIEARRVRKELPGADGEGASRHEPLPGPEFTGWLWTFARWAWERGRQQAAAVYAWAIPLLALRVGSGASAAGPDGES